MKQSPLAEKSLDFATKIVILYEAQTKLHKDNTILKQLLRSGTSVGANINEAIFGNSKADFISKLHISLKEANESLYWLKLLRNAGLLEDAKSSELINLIEEIKAMLIASLNTAKNNTIIMYMDIFTGFDMHSFIPSFCSFHSTSYSTHFHLISTYKQV